MRLSRLIAALLCLSFVPAGPLWSQFADSVSGSGAPAAWPAPVLELAGGASGEASAGLAPPGELSNPAGSLGLSASPVPRQAASALAARSTARPRSGPLAAAALRAASETSGEILASPGRSEGDASKADFTQPRAEPGAGDVAPPETGAVESDRAPPVPSRTLFRRSPAEDKAKHSARFMEQMLDPHDGEAFFFRQSRAAMNGRFEGFAAANRMAKVSLHGNPIMENVKTMRKTIWVEDFDNAGFKGKYGQDIARFLISASYFQTEPAPGFLNPLVSEAFRQGYLRGFDDPQAGFHGMRKLAKGKLAQVQPTTTEYFLSGRKKIRELRENPLPADDPGMLRLLSLYLRSIGEEVLLEAYDVELAGRTLGTSERWDSTLILLKPKRAKEDRLLFAIKTPLERQPAFAKPFGRRVVEAADLFAPGSMLRAGYFQCGRKSYYGYQASTLHGKIKESLTAVELAEISSSVGAELGRAARMSLSDSAAGKLRKHFQENYGEIVRAGAEMKLELSAAYAEYVKEAARAGIVPAGPSPRRGSPMRR